MVVFRRKTGHHQAENLEKRAYYEKPSRPVVIVQLAFIVLVTLSPYADRNGTFTDDRSEKKHEKGLEGRNPPNSTWLVLLKLILLVVVLENADAFPEQLDQ